MVAIHTAIYCPIFEDKRPDIKQSLLLQTENPSPQHRGPCYLWQPDLSIQQHQAKSPQAEEDKNCRACNLFPLILLFRRKRFICKEERYTRFKMMPEQWQLQPMGEGICKWYKCRYLLLVALEALWTSSCCSSLKTGFNIVWGFQALCSLSGQPQGQGGRTVSAGEGRCYFILHSAPRHLACGHNFQLWEPVWCSG